MCKALVRIRESSHFEFVGRGSGITRMLESKTRIVLSLLLAVIIGSAGASVSAQGSSEYRLGPEDVIKVNVLRHPEFSGEFLVPADGMLDLPGAGQIQVAGLTLAQVSSSITTRLSKRLVKPEVTVTLKTQREHRIYVLGAVREPGVYDLKQGWRITECIASAAGVDGEPSDCRVVLMRGDTGKQHTLNLSDVLKGKPDANLVVGPGDVLSVNKVDEFPVYVMGWVAKPGMYRMREDAQKIMEVLALAGGLLEDASLSKITVTHASGESESVDLTPVIFEGSQDSNISLVPGDLVVVPRSSSRVAVLGYVNQAGYYSLPEGQKTTLSDALGLAAGTAPKIANLASVLILRGQGAEQQRFVVDMRKFLEQGDASANPEVKPGDVVFVPKSRSPNWDTIVRALSSVSLLADALR